MHVTFVERNGRGERQLVQSEAAVDRLDRDMGRGCPRGREQGVVGAVLGMKTPLRGLRDGNRHKRHAFGVVDPRASMRQ